MKSIKSILTLIDNHILTVLTGFLLVFIPLFPKIPLTDLLPGYIVRLRAEDLAVALTFGLLIIQVLRKKVSLPKYRVTWLIVAYLIVGFLSSLSAIFITQTVPLESSHLLKLWLHFFRRIEYFSLFFVAYAAIKSRLKLKVFLITIFLTATGVGIYGFGQKYMYWPAFSTMNREFSKGMRLYLAPQSRVMSTFAGHYDLAAYLMMLLSFLVPVTWLAKNRALKVAGWFLFFVLYWILMLTASRTSFIGYVVAINVVVFLLLLIKGWKWAIPRWIMIMAISVAGMVAAGDLSDRFFQLVHSPELKQQFIAFQEKLSSPFKKEPPPNAISDDQLAQVTVPSDTPPTPEKPGSEVVPSPTPLPPDVSSEEDEIRRRQATASGSTKEITYSPNALKYGLSVAIRLDALWPRAIEGFKRNPFLGSGYSTLVKGENTEFTQAESTDNDYLRMLGETGLLGALTFLAIPVILMVLAFRNYRAVSSPYDQAILIGFIGATLGLLVNATYIDVFESSKVAYTYWLFAAIVIKVIEYAKNTKKILY